MGSVFTAGRTTGPVSYGKSHMRKSSRTQRVQAQPSIDQNVADTPDEDPAILSRAPTRRRKQPLSAEDYASPVALIRIIPLSRQLGLHPRTISRRVKAGQFPKPIRLLNSTPAWRVSEIKEWLDLQARANEAE